MDCSMPGLLAPTPRVCTNSCPSSWWCHPTTSSSVIRFSSHLQSFPASGSFPMSQFFTSGGQITGVSASASVLPMNIQDLFPLGLTGWISLLSKRLSRVFSSTTVQKRQFFSAQLSLWSISHIHTRLLEKTIALTRQIFVGKVMSLLFNMLSRLVIADHLTCLLRNLYAGQEATVRTRHGTTDWFQIGKGVRQGCMLSPCLFNLYAEYIM